MYMKQSLIGNGITNIILTRYHYVLDEVLYTFQTALIKSVELQEVIFWFGEIYHSGFVCELWNFIFEFYYNFCAIIYPTYERLFKLYFENKEREYKNLLNITVILFESRKNFDVFVNLNLKDVNISTPSDIKLNKWCKDVYKNGSLRLPFIKKFIFSLHYKCYQNILSYLKLIKDATENENELVVKFKEIYMLIIKYFTKYHKTRIINADNYLFDIPYDNKIHILITLIHYLYRDETTINKEEVDYEYIGNRLYNKINNYLNDINTVDGRPYDVLYRKAKYPINPNIGCFKLARFNMCYLELKNIYFNMWEFYSNFSPIWRERFNKYNIKINDTQKEIIFNNDDEHESFYNTFYYETDEQSKKIQNYSIGEINKITPQEWLDLNNIDVVLSEAL
jgi:hypothetical protein